MIAPSPAFADVQRWFRAWRLRHPRPTSPPGPPPPEQTVPPRRVNFLQKGQGLNMMKAKALSGKDGSIRAVADRLLASASVGLHTAEVRNLE